jgi:uncharacterized protein with FMN-binding domain
MSRRKGSKMKQSNFILKLLSLLLTLGFFLYYQTIAGQRAQAVAENEAAISEIEAYNREIQQENEALLLVDDEITVQAESETGPYVSGIYQGEGTGYGGSICVTVTVTNGYIESVEVTDHSGEDPAYYNLAESIVSEMIDQQTYQVDAATGATFSSRGLMEAVSAALEQAVK